MWISLCFRVTAMGPRDDVYGGKAPPRSADHAVAVLSRQRALKSMVALRYAAPIVRGIPGYAHCAKKYSFAGSQTAPGLRIRPREQAMSGRKCRTRTRRRHAFSGCIMSRAGIGLLYAQKKRLPHAFSDGRSHVQMLACQW